MLVFHPFCSDVAFEALWIVYCHALSAKGFSYAMLTDKIVQIQAAPENTKNRTKRPDLKAVSKASQDWKS
jgi:hypothetical protein